MNFDLYLKTGESSISGCRGVSQKTNFLVSSSEGSFFMSSAVTGVHSSIVSLNSQTIVEGDFFSNTLPFVTINETSGDYYVNSGNSYLKGLYSNDFSVSGMQEKRLIFDLRNSEKSAIFESTGVSFFNTGIQSAISSLMPTRTGSLNTLDFFINGQKLRSGDSYFITGSNNGFQYLETVTGKMFCIPKPTGTREITGTIGDVYGSGFIESNNNFYLNGLEQHPDSWIEFHTGVIMVKTGISAAVEIDDSEFIEIYL